MSYLETIYTEAKKEFDDANISSVSPDTRGDEFKIRQENQLGFVGNLSLAFKASTHIATMAGKYKREAIAYNVSKQVDGTDYIRQAFEGIAGLATDADIEKELSINYADLKTYIAPTIIGLGGYVEDTLGSINAIYGKATAEGVQEGYKPSEYFDELTQGVDPNNFESILEKTSLPAALRARDAVIKRQDQEYLIGQQVGFKFTRFLGMLPDVDAPLTAVSYGTTKALTAIKAAKMVEGSTEAIKHAKKAEHIANRTKLGKISADVAIGTKEGLKAGAAIGVGEALAREGSGFDEAVIMASLGALTGAILSAPISLLTSSKPGTLTVEEALDENLLRSVNNELKKAGDDYVDRLVLGEEKLGTDARINEPGTTEADVITDAGFVPYTVKDGSVGARQTPGSKIEVEKPEIELKDLEGNKIKGGTLNIIERARKWREESNFKYNREQNEDSFIYKVANNKFIANLSGTRMITNMLNTESSILNRLGNVIFASANGYNRAGMATASALKEVYHRKAMSKINGIQGLMHEYAKARGSKRITANTIEMAHKASFMRAIRLERNARRFGRKGTDDVNISAAADMYDELFKEAYSQLSHRKSKDASKAVEGFEGGKNENPHYTPYIWGKEIYNVITGASDKRATRAAIQRGIANAYKAAGQDFTDEIAMSIANAVITRAMNKSARDGGDMGIGTLLSKQSTDELEALLKAEGISKGKINAFMKKIDKDRTEAGKLGIAKSRNELDLEHEIELPDGSVVQVLDLMSNNLEVDAHRYVRASSGASALARHGIRSRKDRADIIHAATKEQEALGITPGHEHYVTPQQLEAMMTAFDGGAQKGVIGDGALEEQGQYVALSKRMVILAWLDKLGLTQLGETGISIAQFGAGNFFRYGIEPLFNRLAREDQNRLLEELSFFTGHIGKDHEIFTPHIDLDEVSGAARGKLMHGIQQHSENLSNIQAYLSGFNYIRAWQQKLAAAAASDSIFRQMRKGHAAWKRGEEFMTPAQKAKFLDDYNFNDDGIDKLMGLIDNGTIEFTTKGKNTFVNRLNVNKWDPDLADEFGANVITSVNQTTQKALAGEQDPFMFTKFGSLGTQLITFPMLAFQKQTIRYLKHKDATSVAAVAYSTATAGLVSYIKALQDGKEMSHMEHAGRAVAYSNMTGWLFMMTDPLANAVGADSLRYNKYSDGGINPPVLSYLSAASRLPGALFQAAKGTADYKDMQSVRVLPFTGIAGAAYVVKYAASRNTEAYKKRKAKAKEEKDIKEAANKANKARKDKAKQIKGDEVSLTPKELMQSDLTKLNK